MEIGENGMPRRSNVMGWHESVQSRELYTINRLVAVHMCETSLNVVVVVRQDQGYVAIEVAASLAVCSVLLCSTVRVFIYIPHTEICVACMCSCESPNNQMCFRIEWYETGFHRLVFVSSLCVCMWFAGNGLRESKFFSSFFLNFDKSFLSWPLNIVDL